MSTKKIHLSKNAPYKHEFAAWLKGQFTCDVQVARWSDETWVENMFGYRGRVDSAEAGAALAPAYTRFCQETGRTI